MSAAGTDAAPEPLRIGILGVARISGEAVVLPARALGHRLTAVASRDPARARFFAGLCGVERVHGAYRSLLADPEVDCVYLPLPPALHARWALAAIEAGKHVLCEKPLAGDATAAERVRAAAGSRGVVVHEAVHHLAHPLWAHLDRVLGAGRSTAADGAGREVLGALRSVDVELTMRAPGPDDIRWSRGLGGGALTDLGCYGLQIAHLLARPGGGAPSVEQASMEPAKKGTVDGAVRVRLRYPGGAVLRLHASIVARSAHHRLIVTGSRARIEVDGVLLPHLGGRLTVEPTHGDATPGIFTGPSTYTHQLAAFARGVREGAAMPLRWTLDDSIAVHLLADAVRSAAGVTPAPPGA